MNCSVPDVCRFENLIAREVRTLAKIKERLTVRPFSSSRRFSFFLFICDHNVIHKKFAFATTSPRFALLFARCLLTAFGFLHKVGYQSVTVRAPFGHHSVLIKCIPVHFLSSIAKWSRALFVIRAQPHKVHFRSSAGELLERPHPER